MTFKKIISAFLFFLILTITVTGCSDKSIPDAESYSVDSSLKTKEYITRENCRLIGRSSFDDEKLRLEWTNSGIELCFYGTRIEIMFESDETNFNYFPYISYIIDDEEYINQPVTGSGLQVITDGLECGIHTLKLIKINELIRKPLLLSFINVISDSENTAKLTEPPVSPERKILFIGDSITSGYGNLAESTQSRFKTEDQDGSKTFAAFTAKDLNADASYICYSGKGICKNENGSTDNLLPELFKLASPTKKDIWKNDNWIPQVVVIDAGSNDLDGKATEKEFIQAAINFLKQIRTAYPDAKIVWSYGIMNDGMTDAISSAVRKFNITDNNTFFLKMNLLSGNELGGSGHPNVSAHKARAAVLTPFLKQLMSW